MMKVIFVRDIKIMNTYIHIYNFISVYGNKYIFISWQLSKWQNSLSLNTKC